MRLMVPIQLSETTSLPARKSFSLVGLVILEEGVRETILQRCDHRSERKKKKKKKEEEEEEEEEEKKRKEGRKSITYFTIDSDKRVEDPCRGRLPLVRPCPTPTYPDSRYRKRVVKISLNSLSRWIKEFNGN
uniref:Uncharacterized protein n=1 Tax=Vespula pensylvanica TaxID=30213 RepID=A0A834KA08_VESPE|nr:hypothetical protein H0235_015803 [Vespula pensylvanica]